MPSFTPQTELHHRTSAFEMAALRTANRLLFIAALSFVLLKLAQVHREDIIAHTDRSLFDSMRYGLARRLDDPSFWAVCSAALASTLLLRAIQRAVSIVDTDKLLSLSNTVSVAGTLIAFYLFSVFLQGGTFFFTLGAHGEASRTDPGIIWIQHVEGWVNVGVILCAVLFFHPSLQLVDRISTLRDDTDRERLIAAVRYVANAGVGPLSIGFLVWFYQGTVRYLTGSNADWFREFKPLLGLIIMLTLTWPFFWVFLRTVFVLSDRYRFSLWVLEARIQNWIDSKRRTRLDVTENIIRLSLGAVNVLGVFVTGLWIQVEPRGVGVSRSSMSADESHDSRTDLSDPASP